MKDRELIWKTLKEELLVSTRVFDVVQQTEVTENGLQGDYMAIKAPDWVVIVPVYQGNFVMVRQWRHGEDKLTTELPGGVVNEGEDPQVCAERELLEETGFQAGKMTYLGRCSSNPALFKNHFNVYLAEELTPTGQQHLDADELLDYYLVPVEDAVRDFASGEYTHAYTGTAMMLYFREKGCLPGGKH